MKKAEIRQQLIDHYLDFYTLAYAMLDDDDDARDAVQEALTRTLSKAVLNNPLHYCYQTLRHAAIDTLRHRQRHVPLYGDIAEEQRDESYATLLERVMLLRDNLPDAERALVILHDEKGIAYDDLARLTGLSIVTIRRRLKRAHLKMRQGLTNMKKEEI